MKRTHLTIPVLEQFNDVLSHAVFTRHAEPSTHFSNHPITSFHEQMHGIESWIIDTPTPDLSPERRGDILITHLPNIPLQIRIADCASVMLFDTRNRVIANIHAGWRGLAKRVIRKTIERMNQRFGSRGEDLYAGISPMLGPCCSRFSSPREELPQHMHRFISEENHVDLWAAIEGALRENGVPEKQIENPRLCTFCHPEEFFSYRREGATAGRFSTIIMLQSNT